MTSGTTAVPSIARLSTHVLDTTAGRPAAGIPAAGRPAVVSRTWVLSRAMLGTAVVPEVMPANYATAGTSASAPRDRVLPRAQSDDHRLQGPPTSGKPGSGPPE